MAQRDSTPVRLLSEITSEELVIKFLDEVLAVAMSNEIYSVAYDALHEGYFKQLKPYIMSGETNIMAGLPRPRPLQLFVDTCALYVYFRAWLRRDGIDPDTVKLRRMSSVLMKYECEDY